MKSLSCSTLSLFALVACLSIHGVALGQEQRSRTTPGLVLDTGARHAPCDVLMFDETGERLMATGDDKVVRIWDMEADRFQSHTPGQTLRWPTFREQRGGIFALALSPNGRHLAVAGFGAPDGRLAILGRRTGRVVYSSVNKRASVVHWALAYSPDGEHLVSGNDLGQIHRWDPQLKAVVPFASSGPLRRNRVRLLHFLDKQTFLSVAEDGKLLVHDVLAPDSPPRQILATLPGKARAFQLDAKPGGAAIQAFRVAISGGSEDFWLAGVSQDTGDNTNQFVELLRLTRKPGELPEVLDRVELPVVDAKVDRFAVSLAFHPNNSLLAVGTQDSSKITEMDAPFYHVTGGKVFVYERQGTAWKRLSRQGLDTGYRTYRIAFRPGATPSQVAVAGGPNDEVRLFDWRTEKALDEVRSPGSALWALGVSSDGKEIAWKDQLNLDPKHPNGRGAGPWKVFNLEGDVHRIRTLEDGKFKPLRPLDSLDAWKVRTTENSFLWTVTGPMVETDLAEENGKYMTRVNDMPLCYTFLKPSGKYPARLAVGHTWGVSIYELTPGLLRFKRYLVGHESQVVALAPSPDGKLLYTASRDQTICCFSLEDWPSSPELGASFRTGTGKLIVDQVDAGSPAWEMGLSGGDEIYVVVSPEPLKNPPEGFVYNPENRDLAAMGLRIKPSENLRLSEIATRLQSPTPARECIMYWRRKGVSMGQLTTVRQRPLWRFFPTRDGDWVLWRWRDFYYDTNSAKADRLVGWQVNPGRDDKDQTPTFYPLEQFRGPDPTGKGDPLGFHNPAKVWGMVDGTLTKPETVQFADIEPPLVALEVITPPDGTHDLTVQVSVQPRSKLPGQQIDRLTLWLDDVHFDGAPAAVPGGLVEKVTIPRDRLRRSINHIRLSAYNTLGGRAEKTVEINYTDPTRPAPNLHAVVCGINNYSKTTGWRISNLRCAQPDAEEVARILKQHTGGYFGQANVTLIPEDKATAKEILASIQAIKSKASADDWFVLFLAGHGEADRKASSYEPGSFHFICADSSREKKESLLFARDLREALASIPCRKLVLLDACRSGAVVSNPVRDFKGEAPFLLFTAARPDQAALEPIPGPGVKLHGFFTQGLMAALGESAAVGAKKRIRSITAEEMARTIQTTIGNLLVKVGQARVDQTPVFDPDPLPAVPVLARP